MSSSHKSNMMTGRELDGRTADCHVLYVCHVRNGCSQRLQFMQSAVTHGQTGQNLDKLRSSHQCKHPLPLSCVKCQFQFWSRYNPCPPLPKFLPLWCFYRRDSLGQRHPTTASSNDATMLNNAKGHLGSFGLLPRTERCSSSNVFNTGNRGWRYFFCINLHSYTTCPLYLFEQLGSFCHLSVVLIQKLSICPTTNHLSY